MNLRERRGEEQKSDTSNASHYSFICILVINAREFTFFFARGAGVQLRFFISQLREWELRRGGANYRLKFFYQSKTSLSYNIYRPCFFKKSSFSEGAKSSVEVFL